VGDNVSLGVLTGRVFAAVLFDMDGTLVDSTAAVERAWRRWGEEFGVEMHGFGTWHGIPSGQIVRRYLAPERWDEGCRRIEELETQDVEGVVVLPGAESALRTLATASAARSAIATSCLRGLAQARIAASGLVPPEVVVTADMVEVGKPDPAPYLLAASKLGYDAADCLVVEDAPAGLESALAAGSARLALATTMPADRLQADAVVTDLSAVRFEVHDDGVRIVVA